MYLPHTNFWITFFIIRVRNCPHLFCRSHLPLSWRPGSDASNGSSAGDVSTLYSTTTDEYNVSWMHIVGWQRRDGNFHKDCGSHFLIVLRSCCLGDSFFPDGGNLPVSGGSQAITTRRNEKVWYNHSCSHSRTKDYMHVELIQWVNRDWIALCTVEASEDWMNNSEWIMGFSILSLSAVYVLYSCACG